MKLFAFITLLATATAVLALDTEPPSELVIETTLQPTACPEMTDNGDKISVHYVSFRIILSHSPCHLRN